MENRNSFVFYRSFLDAIEDLEEAEQLKAFWYIAQYGLDGLEPDEKSPARAVFKSTKAQIDANYKRYQNGTKGGRPKTEKEPNDNQTITKRKPSHNQAITKAEPNVNDNVNVNVNDNEKIDNRAKATRFMPPTPENVSGYCREKGYKIDAERFVDFYESKGWMVGKNKMKDWKAAVRNWVKQDKTSGLPVKPKATGFNNFEQRDTEYNSMVVANALEWLDNAKGEENV